MSQHSPQKKSLVPWVWLGPPHLLWMKREALYLQGTFCSSLIFCSSTICWICTVHRLKTRQSKGQEIILKKNPTSYYSTLPQLLALDWVSRSTRHTTGFSLVTPLPLPAPLCSLAAGSPCCVQHPDLTALMATATWGLFWTRVRTQTGENTELGRGTISRIQLYG